MEFLQKLRSFIWTRHFLKHTGLIFLTYFVIVGITILYLDSYTNHGQKIRVPNLVGSNAGKSRALLEELDLKMELLDSVYRPELPAGTVLAQDPTPTSKSSVYVKEGRIIRVQVSKRTQMVEMPYLVGRSQRFVESVLKNRGLKFKVKYRPSSESNGAVLQQLYKGGSIKEGRRIPVGSTITIVVGKSAGGQPVQIPNVYGATISEARGTLSAVSLNMLVGLCEGCTNGQDSTSAYIYYQSPEYIEGILVPAGTTVTVSARVGSPPPPQDPPQ